MPAQANNSLEKVQVIVSPCWNQGDRPAGPRLLECRVRIYHRGRPGAVESSSNVKSEAGSRSCRFLLRPAYLVVGKWGPDGGFYGSVELGPWRNPAARRNFPLRPRYP